MGLPDHLKILKQKRAKPGDSPQDAMSSEMINAISDSILALVRGENIGVGSGIRKRLTEGGLTFIGSATARSFPKLKRTPFQVYRNADTTTTPVTEGLSVYPGYIVTTMAKIGGILLTAIPIPILDVSSSSGAFSVFLQIELTGTPTSVPGGTIGINRYGINKVDVVTDDQLGDLADYENNEVIELRMKWDDPVTKATGHFFIKIADVAAPAENSPPGTIGVITQTLFTSYRSTLIAGDAIIVFP